METPDVIDLRKQQRKEPDRPLYQVSKQSVNVISSELAFFLFLFSKLKCDLPTVWFFKVLEEKEEKVAPGTLLVTTHTYAVYLLLSFYDCRLTSLSFCA